MVIDALRGSIFVSAVNLPFEGVTDADAKGLVNLSEKLGLFAAQLINGPVAHVQVETWGVPERLLKILNVAALKGVLTPHLEASVNFVNAEQVAEQRGITSRQKWNDLARDYAKLITLRAGSNGQELCVSGTLFSEHEQRIVSIDSFRIEFRPEGHLVYLENRDLPGIVGKVGSALGDHEINIAEYNLARNSSGGRAIAIINVDTALGEKALNALRSIAAVEEVKLLHL
jgi:D-3-phosphoglycerate dehydrogenase